MVTITEIACTILYYLVAHVWGETLSKIAVPIHSYEVPCHPEQVHISYGDTVSEMTVLWSTEYECSAEMMYGIDPWLVDLTAKGETIAFEEMNYLGLRYLHRVKLQNLRPGTTYFYRPVSNGISSGPYYFKTPPSGQNWVPDFMVYGDLGIESDSIPYLNTEILKGRYTAVLHVGDFAYQLMNLDGQNNNTANETCYTKVGDQYMRLIEDIAARVPYMTSPGNHEIDMDTFAHYRHRFSMPKTKWPMPVDKLWYSIDIGPVHFVSYSTEVFFTQQGTHVADQKNWLMSDLKQANDNRGKVPWVVAFGHRPMYCSNLDNDDCTRPDSLVRAGLEDIFFNYGVDVVIQAHEHSYERLWPQYKGIVVAKNYTNPQAPVQIITGSAGSRYGADAENITAADWSAFRLDNKSLNSFGRLQVVNKTHLYWEQVHVHSFAVLDSLCVVQELHGPFKQGKLSKDVSQKIATKTKEHNKHTNTGTSNSHGPTLKSNTGEAQEHPNSVGSSDSGKTSVSKRHGFLDSTNARVAIGVGGGVLLLIFIITFLIVRSQRKKAQKYRRWDQTVDYGRKFYSSGYAHIQNNDKETEDFEIEVSDGNLPTSKLLSEGDH